MLASQSDDTALLVAVIAVAGVVLTEFIRVISGILDRRRAREDAKRADRKQALLELLAELRPFSAPIRGSMTIAVNEQWFSLRNVVAGKLARASIREVDAAWLDLKTQMDVLTGFTPQPDDVPVERVFTDARRSLEALTEKCGQAIRELS